MSSEKNVVTDENLIQAFLNHSRIKTKEFMRSPAYQIYSAEFAATANQGKYVEMDGEKALEVLEEFYQEMAKERKEEYGITGNVEETEVQGFRGKSTVRKNNLEVIDEDKALLFILKYA